MKRVIRISLLVILIAPYLIFGTRVRKDIRKKWQFKNTYAIQNAATGLCVRPQDAQFEDDVHIIGYTHHDWECITWEMVQLQDSTFLLKNLFTEKTFQPASQPKEGVELRQKSMGGTPLQYWQFSKQSDNTYAIRLKGTDLYLTATSDQVDSPLVLSAKDDSKKQKWKLVHQTPWI